MARKKVEAKDISLRLPLNTLAMVEELADIEGLPVATWLAQVIGSHVRHHAAQMNNAKAAKVLDSMLEHLSNFDSAGWDPTGGGVVAPPPRFKNETKPEKQDRQKRAVSR